MTGIIVFFLYFMVGGITFKGAMLMFDIDDIDDAFDSPGPLLAAIFWPVVLPLGLGYKLLDYTFNKIKGEDE